MYKIIFVFLILISNILAENKDYEISLLTAVTKTLDTKIEKQLSFGLAIGKNFKNSFIDQIELSHLQSKNTSYKNTSEKTKITRTTLNAIFNLSKNDDSTFFALIGLGNEHVNNELNDYEGGIFADYGIGYKHKINDYGILKADLRHILKVSGEKDNVSLVLAISIPFGSKIITAPRSRILKIYEEEKVVKAKVIEKIVEEKILVNNDIDNDGVLNEYDQCKNTPNGSKVNNIGCIISVDLDINFESNSDKINKKYINKLTKFAVFLNDNPTYNVIIKAYTDSKGSHPYNLILSQKRANSTINELIKLNVNESRLKSIGYGEQDPIASNFTKEGRAYNRRVSAVIKK
ncbi:MAG: OmpA family protein [Campylobacterales bacterium]|nr:OmpA family protein [Campylobacterales bacterium]